jgi:hypothetical protein
MFETRGFQPIEVHDRFTVMRRCSPNQAQEYS